MLRALAHPVRRQLVRACLDGPRAAGELVELAGLAAASVSEHLKVLRKSGVLVLERRGRFRLYLADPDVVGAAVGELEALVSTWGGGYGATPLSRKLGVKEGQRLALLDAPEGFVADGLAPLPDGVELRDGLDDGAVDLAVAFVTEAGVLERSLPGLAGATAPDGAFWIAWPKRSSGVPSDVTEDRIRDLALPRGLVDTKVCAISDVWSGLRLCLRRELR